MERVRAGLSVDALEPDLSAEFECLASTCPDSCCHTWDVGLARGEASAIASHLGVPVRSVVAYPLPGRRKALPVLARDESGVCILLDETGLCEVHRPGTIHLLPTTCAAYPRLERKSTFASEVVWALSCPEVARLVCASPDGRLKWVAEPGRSDADTDRLAVLNRYNESRGSRIWDVFADVWAWIDPRVDVRQFSPGLGSEGVAQMAETFWRLFMTRCADECVARRPAALFRQLAESGITRFHSDATVAESELSTALRSIGGHLLWSMLEPGRALPGAVVEAALYLAMIRGMALSGILQSDTAHDGAALLAEATYITCRHVVQNSSVRMHMRRTAPAVARERAALQAILGLLNVVPVSTAHDHAVGSGN